MPCAAILQFIAQKGFRSKDVIFRANNTDFLVDHVRTLIDGTWLNDEVMNMTYHFLQTLNNENVAKLGWQPSLFFNSFFFSKLTSGGGYDYAQVRRWTRKFKLTDFDSVYLPIISADFTGF